MAEWGRKEYSKKWPSRTPVWTWAAILLTLVFFAGMLTLEYERSWTAAERLYLTDYLKSGARGKASATAASKYTLLEAVVGPNQKQGQRLVIGDEIEEVPAMDGRPGYRLTEEGVKDGIARLTWVTGTFNDRGLHRVMGEAVYGNIGSWDFYQKPVYLSLAFFVLALFVAVPKDRARRMIWKHGRRLRGPEPVTTAEFNEKLGKSKGMRVHLPDGVSFINEEIGKDLSNDKTIFDCSGRSTVPWKETINGSRRRIADGNTVSGDMPEVAAYSGAEDTRRTSEARKLYDLGDRRGRPCNGRSQVLGLAARSQRRRWDTSGLRGGDQEDGLSHYSF